MPAEPHFRAFARRAVNLAATVTKVAAVAAVATGAGGATGAHGPKPARLLNLGLGGACIEVSAELDVGAAVTLEVTAPNLWDPLIVPATVAWIRAGGPGASVAGIAFDHTRKTALPALVELLAAYRYE